MIEEGEDVPMVYPNDLDVLLNKKITFRVKVQPTFSQASVYKLDDDETFVAKIENEYIVDENQTPPIDTKVVTSEYNLELSAQTLSASGENDPECNSSITSTKVISSVEKGEHVDCELCGATQFSGTKPTKKVKVEPNN